MTSPHLKMITILKLYEDFGEHLERKVVQTFSIRLVYLIPFSISTTSLCMATVQFLDPDCRLRRPEKISVFYGSPRKATYLLFSRSRRRCRPLYLAKARKRASERISAG
jgi:hypothetical protein